MSKAFIFLMPCSCCPMVGQFLMVFVTLPRYTHGQPVPGQVFMEVSRDLFPYIVVPEVTRLCLNKTAKVCQ